MAQTNPIFVAVIKFELLSTVFLDSPHSEHFLMLTDEIGELIDEKTELESKQDFDGTKQFEEESLNEEIKEELIDTVLEITGNELNEDDVLDKLEVLNDEQTALEQIENLDDKEKGNINEELKNRLFQGLIENGASDASKN